VTRITAAKSLLKEELRKTNPSSASVAAFRKAAYGDESQAETNLDRGGGTTDDARCDVVASSGMILLCATGVKDSVILPTVEVQPMDVEVETRQENEVTASEDEVMSIGDSDEGEDGFDGFSVSGRSTSGGDSVISRGSRKRRADESPEREITGSVRKGFPGVVSRSEAGCRIHLPPTKGETTVAPNIPTPPTTRETTVAPNIPTPPMTGEKTVAPNIPTSPTTGGDDCRAEYSGAAYDR